MNSTPTAISCQNLWKVFGDSVPELSNVEDVDTVRVREQLLADGHVVAAANISLDIQAGEFFVLMGLSGSGKSTLLRCLSRLSEPTSGRIDMDGLDLMSLDSKALMEVRRSKMGMVFQHFGLFPHMNVLENVSFPLRVQGVSGDERNATALKMISLVGLEGRDSAMPHELSGGQKQRVGIARSLAADPQLWFLDEPFSALDPLIRSQMQAELLSLQTELKKTIVFVTHDFTEAVRLADRIAIMRGGMIEQVGRPADLILDPATAYVKEFVADAPRARILTLSHLQEPCDFTIEPNRCRDASTSLERVLPLAVDGGGPIGVIDSSGALVGCVRPDRIAFTLGRVSDA